MSRFFDLRKTALLLCCGLVLWGIFSVLDEVNRWNGGAAIALYFVALFVGLLFVGIVIAPAKLSHSEDYAHLIKLYSRRLARGDMLIYDVQELPASKDKIGTALLAAIKGMQNNNELTSALRVSFIELSRFQTMSPRQKHASRLAMTNTSNPIITAEVLEVLAPLIQSQSQEQSEREARLSELDALLAEENGAA